jgi:hypothetical protein
MEKKRVSGGLGFMEAASKAGCAYKHPSAIDSATLPSIRNIAIGFLNRIIRACAGAAGSRQGLLASEPRIMDGAVKK